MITEYQEFMIGINLERKSRDLIDQKGENLVVTLGMGAFDFNPPSFLDRPPAIVRDYGHALLNEPDEFKSMILYAQSELTAIRANPMQRLGLSYSPKTWIGPPTLINESDDIALMGFLMQKFATNHVYAGDFIRGFRLEGDCLYQKVIEFHSLPMAELQMALKEGLTQRLQEY